MWVDVDNNRQLALIWSAKEAMYKLPGMEGLGGPDMDVRPIDELSNEGNFSATIRMGNTIQRFNLQYYYMEFFNVVWVCCDPKTLVW